MTSDSPKDRYSRQELFPGIGKEGQTKLGQSRVTLIGCGALGSHIAQHLVRAGVGFVRVCDRDYVELNNLQRQVLFDEKDVAEHLPKVVAAAQKLGVINSEVEIDPRVVDVSPANVMSLIDGADVVLDGTDNFVTRFLLNDACVQASIPWVYGGCVGSHGMVLPITPGETPCFACFLPELPDPGTAATCDTAGVLGPAIGVVSALQSSEAIKMLVGAKDRQLEGLLTVDLWRNDYRPLKLKRNPDCDVCGKGNYRYLHSEIEELASVLCGRNAVQISPARSAQLDLDPIATRLASHGDVLQNAYLLRFTQPELELTLFPDGRAVIKGTDDPSVARAHYTKYVGN